MHTCTQHICIGSVDWTSSGVDTVPCAPSRRALAPPALQVREEARGTEEDDDRVRQQERGDLRRANDHRRRGHESIAEHQNGIGWGERVTSPLSPVNGAVPRGRHPAGEAMPECRGLLVDLLEHEGRVAALLGGLWRPVDQRLGALLDLACDVGHDDPRRPHVGDVALLEEHHAVRVGEDRGHVARDEAFLAVEPDDPAAR